ncbi:MAG TPA: hypothetical protein VMH48_03320 [Methylomirabilota bacterium]|nr:hypothetical protein [Methylomirabilota bacterium]
MKKVLLGCLVSVLFVALLAWKFVPRAPLSAKAAPAQAPESAPKIIASSAPQAAPPSPPSAQNPESLDGSSDQLPASLLASIEANLPGYHLPQISEKRKAETLHGVGSPFSFYCQGDFTSSGHQEFALILEGSAQIRFAIFSPDSSGQYRLVYLARPKTLEEWGKDGKEYSVERPEQIDLRTIAKGESWAPEAGDTFEDLKVPADAIDLHSHPKPNYDLASLIVFKDGAFQQIPFEPLVPIH